MFRSSGPLFLGVPHAAGLQDGRLQRDAVGEHFCVGVGVVDEVVDGEAARAHRLVDHGLRLERHLAQERRPDPQLHLRLDGKGECLHSSK